MSDPLVRELRLVSGETLVCDWIPPQEPETAVSVFVHGLGSHRRGDKALHFAERFAKLGWGFLAPDLRGHGQSGGSLEDLSLTRCLEDLGAAIGSLPAGAAPRLLIGSSMGGAVAAWYQLLFPHASRHIALIAPSLRFPGRFLDLPRDELAAWKRGGSRRFASEWIDIKLGYGLVEDGAGYPYGRLLREYDTPTLILHGMGDTTVPWQESAAFIEQARAKDVDLLLVKNGDHRLTAHKSYLFDAIAAWLRCRGLLP
jgi:alpha-beta hydrolase superfamily lysophospholipase